MRAEVPWHGEKPAFRRPAFHSCRARCGWPCSKDKRTGEALHDFSEAPVEGKVGIWPDSAHSSFSTRFRLLTGLHSGEVGGFIGRSQELEESYWRCCDRGGCCSRRV